ncbi:GGDEF domain-containing protein [Paraburkholderia caballeronis]|uniref:Diguanylate cyclase (GGDEF) domain-containing protein n=1 Tax=Paraburkholderia caballeronis TaxID=416943 RepID=A0A1H7SAL3_9BURK|nr:GGDEF domain-containing protein [Paraburkholderia caballeronis]PXW22991.1 diguanylate cyclase (GGDEF)-like protein [Paraburkholderia caballeronis]PXW97376.1 diguanylate cyclase (GGDEF)-like protein [Paraburkholderia caballeronis]RAJ93896.1 diguanylate cyclase (GGDEF)-like protein [Paraburkholderia caballeronis]SEE42325.1 diguanylate cyclase (GGDEF) domain-containing protein [Paraburkholderia caballeronis]SEL69650.1 diguanylate cyclase (GGDEF) domain-containing protein [Paraburkholderia caba
MAEGIKTTFTLPRGRLANWLLYPGRDTPHEIRVALASTLFGTLPIFLGGVFNTIAVAAVLEHRHPTLPFQAWLAAEIIVCLLRLVVLILAHRRARYGKPTLTDAHVLLAPLWGATVGYGALVSAFSGDWIASTLSFLSAAAMVGGICFRNFAAPRLVAVMIFLSLGPCCVGAIVAGEPVLWLTLVQIPFYLFAMSAAAWRLNGMLISTMESEREHDRRASHDGLTGLLNREGLFLAARPQPARAARIRAGMPLYYLDLDGFKAVNDAYGHEFGDRLLVEVATRLKDLAGPNALVARMGGDEFVIVGDAPAGSDASRFAACMNAEIERPFDLAPNVTVKIGASIGYASVTAEGNAIDTVLGSADAAMYEAKRNRKERAAAAERAPAWTPPEDYGDLNPSGVTA